MGVERPEAEAESAARWEVEIERGGDGVSRFGFEILKWAERFCRERGKRILDPVGSRLADSTLWPEAQSAAAPPHAILTALELQIGYLSVIQKPIGYYIYNSHHSDAIIH